MKGMKDLSVEKDLNLDNDGSALTKTRLSLLEGVSLIVGTNIGAGVLSLAFGSKLAGWPVLLFWIVLTGVLTTIMMLYVAETTLRTKKSLQLKIGRAHV